LIEGHVLSHLNMFVGSVEEWLEERVRERGSEHQARIAAVERQREALDALDGQRERHLAEYRRLSMPATHSPASLSVRWPASTASAKASSG
jgi:hypothetical protein